MPNEQQKRHKRFDELWAINNPEHPRIAKREVIKSFLDEEVALALANREKEIVEMIDKECWDERGKNDDNDKLITVAKLKNIISKNK